MPRGRADRKRVARLFRTPASEDLQRDPLYGTSFPRLPEPGPLAAFPEAGTAAAALASGEPRPLAELLHRLDTDAERVPPLTAAVMRAVGPDPGVRPALDRWVTAEPGEWRAWYARAEHALACSRSLPGPASVPPPGQGVGADAWARHAEEDLLTAVHLAPGRPEGWTGLVRSATRLRIPVAERVRRYEEVHARAAFFPPGIAAAAVALGRRHGGSSEEALGLVRLILEKAGRNHAALLGVPMVHLEITAGAAEPEAEHYFHREHVLADLDDAFAAWWDGTPLLSTPAQWLAANAFAAAFTRAGRNDEVRACLRKIDDLPDLDLWGGFALSPVETYQLVRSRLGLLGTPARARFRDTVPDPEPGA